MHCNNTTLFPAKLTQRFAHLPSGLVSHHCVQVHSREGKLAGEMQGHHHHACHPEEKNVKTSLQQGGWEEGIEISSLLRGR